MGENGNANECSDAVGKEIKAVANASWDKEFLHDFGQATVGDANHGDQQKGSFAVGRTVGNELFPITPEACEGEGGIHKKMNHLVEADDGLGMGQIRTRKSS